MTTPLEIALAYIGRRWNPVPVEYRTKKPIGNAWQSRIIDADNAAQHFNGEQMNIGVVLGPTSRKLTDVDEDADEAICIGPYVLPRTKARFGRASKRDSHQLYYTELSAAGLPAALAFDDPRKPKQQGRLVELRIGGDSGAQTVLPGSVHKTGETITWEESGEPETVDGDNLLRCVKVVAAYSLLARYWPGEGSGHHDTARVVGGFLARAGLGPETIRTHVEAIAKAANSTRWKELSRTAEDAAAAFAAGKRTFGFNGLRESFGPDIAEKVAEWLDYRDPERTAKGNGKGRSGTAHHDWDDPDWSILDDRRGELPAFPVDVFSKPCQAWLTRAAVGAGVTPDHVAVPLLGIVSALVGTARRIQATRSWLTPCTTWVAVVGYSGTGKTPGSDVTKNALSMVESSAAYQETIDALRRSHEACAEKARAELKKWKKAVEDAVEKNEPTPAKPATADDPGPFVTPRLFVSNVTIERATGLLQARPRGILGIYDELAGLLLNMSRYSGGQDNEFWLESWNGKRYILERVGRPADIIPHLLIGIIGGLQPDKLARCFSGDEDGMYARYCFSWPEEPGYQDLTDEVQEVEPEILNALKRIIELKADADGVFAPRAMPLTKEARNHFGQFLQFVHREKVALDGRERDWLAKGSAHVLRLAGTLALLDWALGGTP